MSLRPDLFLGASPRRKEFSRQFEAHDFLVDRINEVLKEHEAALKVKPGAERNLSLVVVTGFGKGMKTSQAILRLCLLGYGEDALILLRSNANLLINLAYILEDPNPTERAADFLAYSYKKRAQYIRLAHGVESPPWPSPVPEGEVERRADSWGKLSIEAKACKVGIDRLHYTKGYRFYSSFEHSEAFALNDYIDDWNEIGPVIGSQEDSKYVSIALLHNFAVTADLLLQLCRFYKIERPDIVESLRAKWADLGAE